MVDAVLGCRGGRPFPLRPQERDGDALEELPEGDVRVGGKSIAGIRFLLDQVWRCVGQQCWRTTRRSTMVVAATIADDHTSGSGQHPRRLVRVSHRPLHPPEISSDRPPTTEACGPARTDPPRHIRRHRLCRPRQTRWMPSSKIRHSPHMKSWWTGCSPRYGERWGRHWLDVARFSEGFERDLVPEHARALSRLCDPQSQSGQAAHRVRANNSRAMSSNT